LSRIIQTNTTSASTEASASNNNKKEPQQKETQASMEQQLLKMLIEFLQFSFQYQVEQQKLQDSITNNHNLQIQQQQQHNNNNINNNVQQQFQQLQQPALFTNIFLTNLRQCLKSLIITQMDKNKLKLSVSSDTTRSEILKIIVMMGSRVANVADKQLRDDWHQTLEAFITFLN
jgi:hypothetical protein